MAGSLQYIVVDVMSLPSDTMPRDWPKVICWKGWKDLDQLFNPRILITRAYQFYGRGGGLGACEPLFSAWTSAVRSLSHKEVNDCERPRGKTVLNQCLALLLAVDEAEDIVREDDPETLHQVQEIEYETGDAKDEIKSLLKEIFDFWAIDLLMELDVETVEASFPRREAVKAWAGQTCEGGSNHTFLLFLDLCLDHGLGEGRLNYLINMGLEEWCWFDDLGPKDSPLQHILKPSNLSIPARYEKKPDSWAELCIFLAQRLNLKKLCHLNSDGRNALSYATEYAKTADCQAGPWIEVPHVIKEQMEEQVRCFRGSLLELVELARRVWAGLGGNLALLRRA